jgi:hypothetical protein
MSIPPEIQSLIARLNQELQEIEQEASEGENLLRELSKFIFLKMVVVLLLAIVVG